MSERTWGFKSPLAHDFSPLKAWLPGLLFAAAALPFLNGLRGAFVYDDIPIIAQSPLVRGRAPLSAFFASSYWRHAAQAGVSARGGLYRPLTILSYALTWRLGTGAPWAFHAGNILLHALTTLVLFSLLKRLGSSRGASALGAAAFAVLPVHVEAVSWCVGRAELLAAFLMLAAWRLLHREERRGRLAAGLACYALALLSKESAAPLPAALILGELLGSGAPRELVRRRLPVWLAAFGVLLGYLSWRASVLGSALVVGAPYFGGRSRLVVLLTMAKFFVRGWLLPMATGLGLSPDYSRPDFPDAAPTDALAWACAAAAAALLALALRSFWRKRSPWAFAVLVFAALAAPLSNLLVPMEILGADRILYIPSLAFGALLAAGWDRLRSRRAAAPRMGAAALCLLAWTARTASRNRIWRDEASLYRAGVAEAPRSPRMLSGLGTVLDREGRRREARDLYRRALESDPGHALAAYDMGKSFFEEGDLRSARAWFSQLERGSLADPDTFCFLGLIAEKEARYGDALAYYARALERDPYQLEARRNAGLLLYRLGDARESRRQLELYLEAAPPPAEAAEVRVFLERIVKP